MRLFFALDLPPGVGAQLRDAVASRRDWFGLEAGRLRWPSAENLHVTLKFLGEVPDAQVPAVCDAAKEVLRGLADREPLRLAPVSLACFPSRGPANLLAVLLQGDEDRLQQLYAGLETAMEALGFARERRPFRPHVTVARCRRNDRVPGAISGAIRQRPQLTADPFSVDSISLYVSDLLPAGPVYRVVERYWLTASPPR